MLKQIKFELIKMSARPRSYIAFAAFFAACLLLTIGVKYGGFEQMIQRPFSGGNFELIGSPLNAEFMTWLIIGSPISYPILIMWLPLFFCLIFGEILAGENSEGTLRMLLTRPVSRARVYFAKLITGYIYSILVVAFLGISTYVIGYIVFGSGGLISTGSFDHPMIAWYNKSQAFFRLSMAYIFVLITTSAVGMIAYLLSIWIANAIGSIGGALMFSFTTLIIGEIPYFAYLKPYLLGPQITTVHSFFIDPIPWDKIILSLICVLSYIVACLLVSLVTFLRKDISS